MHLLFEGKLTAGDILMCISFLVAVFGAYNKLTERLTMMEVKLDAISIWWNTCAKGACPMVKELKERDMLVALRKQVLSDIGD